MEKLDTLEARGEGAFWSMAEQHWLGGQFGDPSEGGTLRVFAICTMRVVIRGKLPGRTFGVGGGRMILAKRADS